MKHSVQIKIEDHTFVIMSNPRMPNDAYYSIHRVENEQYEWFYFYYFEDNYVRENSIQYSLESISFLEKYRAAISKFRKLRAFM